MIENREIASRLDEVADLLEIQEANPFRVRAYRNAVRTVLGLSTQLERMVAEEHDLTELSGIGKEMARHITELVETGESTVLDELRKEVPSTLVQIMRLPGVGPKSARKLWEELDIQTIEDLKAAAEEGRVAELKGFGEKTQTQILAGIDRYHRYTARYRLDEADEFAEPLIEYMKAVPEVKAIEIAGSYRRRKETVGDIDVLVEASKPEPVMERFVTYPPVDEVLAAGGTRGSVRLRSGLQVDLRIVPRKSYGAALVYFTGSKEHNIKLRQRALARGLTVSEYGVFELPAGADPSEQPDESGEANGGHAEESGKQVAGRTETDVYATVDLPPIPPELREMRGEIDAAEAGRLPELIEFEEIRGDLQMHSTWSDGKNTIEEMLEACAGRGYEYFALTDHSQALAMIEGLDEANLKKQLVEISEIAERHPEIRILRSMEVDIHADGTLDLADEMLGELDLVLVSIHSMFNLPRARQTERVVKAISHPEVDILGHPTGRLINRRDPIDFDLAEVLDCAAEHGVAVELNANPHRLDLSDTQLMLAKEKGVKVVISTDAHSTRDLALMRYGVEQARRAWLEKGDVLNTLPGAELLSYFGLD